MTIDRRAAIGAVMTAGFAAGSAAATKPKDSKMKPWPAPSETIWLWPNGAPGSLNPARAEKIDERAKDALSHDRAMSGITKPRLDVFPAKNPNGAAMLITPGGGYARVVMDHEGYLLADYLNSLGITAFVLFYRLPAEGWEKASDVPLSDAQRAMRLIRANAARFRIDTARVGMIGFSAGGHLCASLLTRHDANVYAPIDAADSESAKPYLCAPIYPVQSMELGVAHMGSRDNLIGKTPTPEQIKLYSPDQLITPATPPCFLLHAEDDKAVPVENTIRLRAALKAQGVTVETHLFPEGGHGFGMTRGAGLPVGIWPQLFAGFIRARGLIA